MVSLRSLLELPVITAIVVSPQRPLHESPPRPSSVVAVAERRLQNSSYPSHRALRCTYRNGVLTLHGRVSSYYLRQTACALVADLEGIVELVDRIEVVERTFLR